MCFKSKTISAPALQEAPPPPSENDKAIQDALEKERLEAQKRKGRASTILTSGQGLTETATTQKTLLGQ